MAAGGKAMLVSGGSIEAAVEDHVLLAAVGNHFDLADDDVGALRRRRPCRARSVSLNLPMRFAATVNCEPPTRPDSTATFFSSDVFAERKPVARFQLAGGRRRVDRNSCRQRRESKPDRPG